MNQAYESYTFEKEHYTMWVLCSAVQQKYAGELHSCILSIMLYLFGCCIYAANMQQISEYAAYSLIGLHHIDLWILLQLSIVFWVWILFEKMCIHSKKNWPGSAILSDIYGNGFIVMQSRPCDVCGAPNCVQHPYIELRRFDTRIVSSPKVKYISVYSIVLFTILTQIKTGDENRYSVCEN